MESLQEDTSPKELAAQLGADAYKDRTLAQEQLLSIGQRAIPVLKEAETSHDPEIRISARKIISQICDESTKDKRRETIRGVNRALDSLAIEPDKEAWALLLRLMSKVPLPQKHRVAAALGAFGKGTLHKVALALRQEFMTKGVAFYHRMAFAGETDHRGPGGCETGREGARFVYGFSTRKNSLTRLRLTAGTVKVSTLS